MLLALSPRWPFFKKSTLLRRLVSRPTSDMNAIRAETGESYDAIATVLGCGRRTVVYHHKHYRDEATTEDRPCKGRPRVTTAEIGKTMVRMAMRSEKVSTQ